MKKQIIFVPGFGASDPRYLKRVLGFRCNIFIPDWERGTLSDYIREYEAFLINNNLSDFIAIGFSFGALIIACSKVVPKESILIAMTPLFVEDKIFWSQKWIDSIGIKRFADQGIFIAKSNTTFLVGGKDTKVILRTVGRLRGNAAVFMEQSAGHLLEDFVGIIKKLIKV